ncbi:unnamed protein product [Rhizophagus irregularis]|nr:unnamed protein product [Rhizophagus irregularis]
MKTIMPNTVIEWIPYNNLENIKYLTKGGFSKIYTADWIGGRYEEWDSKTQQLERIKRYGIQNLVSYVILKELENVENANQRWFEEAKSHLTMSNKQTAIVPCYEEQEAFYTSSKSYDFNISDNSSSIFSTISNQYTSINFKNRNEDNDKGSSRLSKKLKMENDIQNYYDEETIQQKPNVDIIDEDEVYNNPPKNKMDWKFLMNDFTN